MVGAELTREDTSKLWPTKENLVWDKREILVWNHRLNHCSFKYLLRLSKRGIITNNLIKVKKTPPYVACLFGNYYKRPWRTKGKRSGGSISKHSGAIPGAMKLIDQIVSDQPGLIPQVSGDLNQARFWPATAFFEHYYDY